MVDLVALVDLSCRQAGVRNPAAHPTTCRCTSIPPWSPRANDVLKG